jgi:integrase
MNDAASAKAGRVVRSNPFARLGISRGPGRRHEQPPREEQVWKVNRCARELATPSFAAWLQVAAFTGLRPGELDALRRVNVDLARSRIRVVEQFSATTRTFTLPKNGQAREAPLTDPAREALIELPIEGEFCFAPIQGQHWDRFGACLPLEGRQGRGRMGGQPVPRHPTLRRLAHGQRARPALEDVAIALGHTDGGELVRRLYGHRDRCTGTATAVRAPRPRPCARSNCRRLRADGELHADVARCGPGMPSHDPDTLKRNGKSPASN